MAYLKNLKLSQKLYLLVLCFIAGFAVFGLVFKNTLDTLKINGPIYNDIVQSKDLVADILPPPEYIVESYFVVLQASAASDDGKISAAAARVKKLREEFESRHEYWIKELPAGPMKDMLVSDSYRPAREFFDIVEKEYFPALLAHDRKQALALVSGALDAKYEEHRAAIDKVVKIAGENGAGLEKAATQIISNRYLSLVIIGIAIIALAAVLDFVIIRIILAQLGGEPARLAETTEKIADGDLTSGLDADAGTATGVAAGMKKMMNKLKEVVGSVKGAADNVAAGSQQLSTTSDDLNKGSAELSMQIDQVVTSMTEVSQTIMDMAKNATQAAEASKNASETAAKGKQIVDRTAGDMTNIAATVQQAAGTIEELGKSSAQIGEIVAVINGIADQTNLLALNAAIEAARAGEQGRGFAVVADEVRKLAERTGQATKDIAQRITVIQAAAEESVGAMKKGNDEVNKGVALARDASASLDTIVTASTNAMDMVQRIAAATEQQSAASEEVTQSMESISTIVKRSTGSTEQIKSSAGELARLSSELRALTAWFKLAAQ
jgi:methyl-accepting chemotaxis protein